MYYISAKSILALLPANPSEVRSFLANVVNDSSFVGVDYAKEIKKLEALAEALKAIQP
jgi:hypothetical protein